MKIIERTHNLETGEIVDVERNLTSKEIAEKEEDAANAKILKAEAEAKATAKAALLSKLGITEEEARLLLS